MTIALRDPVTGKTYRVHEWVENSPKEIQDKWRAAISGLENTLPEMDVFYRDGL